MNNGIRDFLQGYANLALDKYQLLAGHIKEQAAWRAYLCSPCLARGHCLPKPDGCGCRTPALFYAPRKTDPHGQWQEMLDKQKWEDFKETDGGYKEFREILESQGLTISDGFIAVAEYRKQLGSGVNTGSEDTTGEDGADREALSGEIR